MNKLRKLIHSTFVRNVAIVAMGTASSQAINMAFAPVITRLYGPESFGVLGTFTAILSVLTPIAALTYPIAIVLPKSDEEARQLGELSAVLASFGAIVVAGTLVFAKEWLQSEAGLDITGGFLLLIPLVMVFAAFEQILTQWCMRKRRFKTSSLVAVIQALSINCAKAGFGWLHPTSSTLIVLTTVGHGLRALLLWIGLGKKQRNSREREPTNGVLVLAKRYRDFPLFRAPQVALNALSQSLPVFILASFFGSSAAGFYSLARMVMSVPSALIGKSVSEVFYPRVAEIVNKRESPFRLILRATLGLAATGFVPFASVAVFGPWLFGFVFGDQWSVAGDYARWLSVWLYLGFLNRPSVAAIAALGLQDAFLVYEIVSVVLRSVALYAGFELFGSDQIAVALFSVAGIVLNIGLVGYTLYRSRRTLGRE